MEPNESAQPKSTRRPAATPRDIPRRKTARERMLELKSAGHQKEDARKTMKKEDYKKALLSQVFKKWTYDQDTVVNDKKNSGVVHKVSPNADDVCAVDELITEPDECHRTITRRKVWLSNVIKKMSTEQDMEAEDNKKVEELYAGGGASSDADDECSVDAIPFLPNEDFGGYTKKELFGSSTESEDASVKPDIAPQ